MATSPHGSWRSPLTSELIVADNIRLGGLQADGADLLWMEGRPQEGGRQVAVRRRPDGVIEDAVPADFNARNRVHEYGGGAVLAWEGRIAATRFEDQRLYLIDPGSPPRPLTPEGDVRHADMRLHRRSGRIVAVQEDHRGQGEARNRLVSVSLDGGEPEVLAEGADFYAAPRPSPDGSRLCWVQWDHPNLPWDTTSLWVADLDEDGSVHNARMVAGGHRESIIQPAWSPDGVLHAVSDRTGWWNVHRYPDGAEPVNLTPVEEEAGSPQWVFGCQQYDWLPDGRIAVVATARGRWALSVLDAAGRLRAVPLRLDELGWHCVALPDGRVALVGGSATEATAVVLADPDGGDLEVVRRSMNVDVDPAYLSVPERIEFPTENGLTAHALYYPPKNPQAQPPAGERPPLLVWSHGGPTGSAQAVLDLELQYWTSRGVAVVDVNYGGSTGYGREYRERLYGQWGVVDVDDCCNAARFLVERGDVDPARLCIQGGSAGGYTTLCALAFRDVFAAGASHFGIGDLMIFIGDTHKFESRYLDQLVGPYPARADLYRERSPIHHLEGLTRPLILFQGLEDKIVPPNQSQMMFDAVRAKGIPCAYLAFEGEQHGFRRAANIRRSLDGQLYFLGRIFGFEPADELEPVEIANLS